MAQICKVGSHKTTILTDAGYTKIVYYNTPVVSFNQDEIILNTGGWRTNTTKLRMNQASNQFNLGFGVYQENFKWFISGKNDEIIPFEGEIMKISRN